MQDSSPGQTLSTFHYTALSNFRARDVASIYLGGGSEICLAKFFRDLSFSVAVVDQMVLGPVNCLAKNYCKVVKVGAG